MRNFQIWKEKRRRKIQRTKYEKPKIIGFKFHLNRSFDCCWQKRLTTKILCRARSLHVIWFGIIFSAHHYFSGWKITSDSFEKILNPSINALPCLTIICIIIMTILPLDCSVKCNLKLKKWSRVRWTKDRKCLHIFSLWNSSIHVSQIIAFY